MHTRIAIGDTCTVDGLVFANGDELPCDIDTDAIPAHCLETVDDPQQYEDCPLVVCRNWESKWVVRFRNTRKRITVGFVTRRRAEEILRLALCNPEALNGAVDVNFFTLMRYLYGNPNYY